MAKRQFYGIKFPISVSETERRVFDLNKSKLQKVKSDLIHVLFTPKGQRLRNPDFGTDLIQFIFNPADNQTWGEVEMEIKNSVTRWVPDCSLDGIEVKESEDGLSMLAVVRYSVAAEDGSQTPVELVVNI